MKPMTLFSKYVQMVLCSFALICSYSCKEDYGNIDFKAEMRKFVIEISDYAQKQNQDFIVIPQNGQELCTVDGEPKAAPATDYLEAIDGVGREDLYYGYNNDNEFTPVDEQSYMISYLDVCKNKGVAVLTTDYCSSPAKMDNSYTKNNEKGYISFAAPSRELNVIPTYPTTPHNVNTNDISTLLDAKNFLYLINPENYSTPIQLVASIGQTNYDVVLIDLFHNSTELTKEHICSLKTKANGGKRLVICYMSIGEAEDYRYYWQSAWSKTNPKWLEEENPDWEGNYKVRYWDEDWKLIIFGKRDSYLDKILAAGFDGVYLDIIDAFEYFE